MNRSGPIAALAVAVLTLTACTGGVARTDQAPAPRESVFIDRQESDEALRDADREQIKEQAYRDQVADELGE